MLKFFILSCGMMIHGIRLQKRLDEKSLESTSGGSLLSKEKGGFVFDLFQCYAGYPKLSYMAWQAASFCRVYPYSCNNLWAEDMNTEVLEGTFCVLNWWEQTGNSADVLNANVMYTQMLSQTLVPWYNMMMDIFAFGFKNGDGSKSHEADLKKSLMQEIPEEYPCSSSEIAPDVRLKCMVTTVKKIVGTHDVTKLDMQNLTPEQNMHLIQRVNAMTEATSQYEESLRQASEVVQKGAGDPALEAMKAELEKRFAGVSKPLKSSLGGKIYRNSWTQGITGRVSADARFAWDHVQPSSLEMKAIELTSVDPLAVCNDGSPALMYQHVYDGGPKTKWHFHVDGGFFCYDKGSCIIRALSASTLVSTKGWERSKNMSGMFDPHLGGLPDYTHAAIGYCSSDAWFGQIEVEDFAMVNGTVLSNGKIGTHFRGYTILQSVLKWFLQQGMASEPGHELFVSGCSAGSIAATAQADSWASRLEKMAKQMKLPFYKPKIWTVLDGAPIISPTPSKTVEEGASPAIYTMAMALVDQLYGPGRGVTPDEFINKDCVAAHPENAGTCVWTADVMPFIKTPNVVLGMFWDNFVTGQLEHFFVPDNPKHYQWALHAVYMAREVLKKVTPQQNFWFSGCGDHCLSDNPLWWRLMPVTAPNGESHTSARDITLRTRDGDTGHVVADACDHYQCGCMGQESGNTKLGLQAIALGMQYGMTGKRPPPMGYSIGQSTGLAAGQMFNLGQWVVGP